MGNIIVYQPDLKELGDSLRGILESFVSNQNSRLFCALADLFEWYRAGMSYSILQLTKKHINSIFKRPPYEERPYTQELTYAQRLIMIYHVLNCEPWDTLMQAYDSLYQSLHNKPWQNKSKFLRADGARSTVAAASYRIIEECNKTVFTPQLFTMDPRLLGIFPPTSSILSKDTVRDGRVSKRRSISSISKTKNTKAVKFFGQGKPRSISLASASEGQSTGFYGLSANNMFPLVPCASVGPSWIGQQLNSSFVPRNENADPCQTMASLIAQSTPFPLIDSSQSTQQTFDSSFYSADTLTTSLNSQTSFSQTQQDQQQQNQLFYSSQELPLPIYHGTAAFQHR
ncbi:hypothetical protein FB639_002619 [Coemansia asiatica]|nr:hypothetical protein FB639_002619 [Coemansia asiatica]